MRLDLSREAWEVARNGKMVLHSHIRRSLGGFRCYYRRIWRCRGASRGP